jgi:hypothetical protein
MSDRVIPRKSITVKIFNPIPFYCPFIFHRNSLEKAKAWGIKKNDFPLKLKIH